MSHTGPLLSPELGCCIVRGKDFHQSLDWAKAPSSEEAFHSCPSLLLSASTHCVCVCARACARSCLLVFALGKQPCGFPAPAGGGPWQKSRFSGTLFSKAAGRPGPRRLIQEICSRGVGKTQGQFPGREHPSPTVMAVGVALGPSLAQCCHPGILEAGRAYAGKGG